MHLSLHFEIKLYFYAALFLSGFQIFICMKYLFTLLCVFSLAVAAFAQPAYDDCSGAYSVGTAPYCPDMDPTFFNNVAATTSVIFSNPADDVNACFVGGNNQNDVWVSFVANINPDSTDYTVTITGVADGAINALTMPQVAVYRGECLADELAEVACASAAIGENSISVDLYGLTPGFTYYLRINNWSQFGGSPLPGAFQVCVTYIIPAVTFCEAAGSTAASGVIYDSGGPDSSYAANENCTYTICPNEPSACLTFNMIYYNIEAGFGGSDQILFFDGPDNTGPNIGQVSGGTGDNSGGGVCLSAQATSGCMTIQFISDADVELEGFMGEWENSQQACEVSGNLAVQIDPTFAEIEEALETPFTTVTITDVNCAGGSYGIFSQGDTTDLGAKKGLLLTSGSVPNVPNPGSFFSSLGTFNGGDPDLDYLSTLFGNGNLSTDVCIVEMDVFAAADQLSFEYVFGSEEYPEYVNSNFNDIFAFFISGPGITGDPLMNNQENMATLPFDGTTPVQINSVNNQTNWQYYRQNNNINGFNATYSNLSGQSITYDGLTSDSLGVKKTLTAQRGVTPCNTYHLKLAIADRGDTAFDSGVFVSEISAGLPKITVNFLNGIDYLLEGCTTIEEQLVIGLAEPLDDTLSFHVNISGTATLGLDYTLTIPSIITFLPGETTFTFPLGTITDLITEQDETILIELSNNFGCGDVIYSSVEIPIEDEPKVIAVNGQDSTYACEGSTVQLTADGGAVYIWTPFSVLDGEATANPIFTGTVSQWVYVTGQVGLCTGHDSVYVQIIDPAITVSATDYQICTQETTLLTAFDNVNHANLIWTPALGLDLPNSATTLASPDVTTTYTAKVTIAGCEATASLTINVDEFTFPQIYTQDTTICQGYSFFLGSTVSNTTTQYDWSPGNILSDSTFSGPIATPTEDVTIFLVATSQNGYCSQSTSVDVSVIEASVDILGANTYEICLGDTVVLGTQVNSFGVGDLSWITYDAAVSGSSAPLIFAHPDQSYWYYANYNVDGCSVFDSIHIRVDSIPALATSLTPVQDIYCPGQIVTIFSPTYDPFGFPDMTHDWSPSTFTQSPVDQFNLVVTPDTTTTYTRITSNKACADTVSVTIEIVDPAFSIAASDTSVCPGETVQLTATPPSPLTTFEWTPTEGLSCSDCPNPIATVNSGPITYTATGTTGDCVSTGEVTLYNDAVIDVTISADPGGSIPTGSPVELTANTNPDVSVGGLFAWSTGQTGYQITVIPLEEINTYSVNIQSPDGCESTATIVINGTAPEYSLPNSFTPNGDDLNDNFNVHMGSANTNISIATFDIYDRWGQRIYNNSAPLVGWDGKFKGKEMPADAYIFHIVLNLPGGNQAILKGDVTLLR